MERSSGCNYSLRFLALCAGGKALAAANSTSKVVSTSRGLPCEYVVRQAVVQTLHQVIDGFLAHSLCRLNLGTLCRNGRDGRPFAEGRAGFTGSDGQWAVSGHSGDSTAITDFLFDIAFERAPGRICEVGFNAGHSAATLLTAAGQNASYLGFDLSVINPGSNEALFEMMRASLGPGHHLEMHWGDVGWTLPRYLEERQLSRPAGCELTFYDGPHDAISVLQMLPLLRRLASRSRPLIVLDDMRCQGLLCVHSSLAWDFLVWAGVIREIRCISAKSTYSSTPGNDRGACLGEFQRGPHTAWCPMFNMRCVADTHREAYPQGLGPQEWPRCCLTAAAGYDVNHAQEVVVF